MILICPDKFKGTLTACEAARIMADGFSRIDRTMTAPMADGGEGTAEIICSGQSWLKVTGNASDRCTYFINPVTSTAVIDSSAVIGLHTIDLQSHNILTATSAPLGESVRNIIESGIKKVFIGIGGTATCDGGLGFIKALGDRCREKYRDCIVGLSDVSVPLVAKGDAPSALMFAPQKGASVTQIEILRKKLEDIYNQYPCRSPFDGAGGGLGFAIASLLGAECHFGAEYVLDSYNIDWSEISMVITGEGRVDRQTSQGKVVDVVQKAAARHGVPCVAFGGCVETGYESDLVIATDRYYAELPLDSTTAAMRLHAAVDDFVKHCI